MTEATKNFLVEGNKVTEEVVKQIYNIGFEKFINEMPCGKHGSLSNFTWYIQHKFNCSRYVANKIAIGLKETIGIIEEVEKNSKNFSKNT